MTIKRIIAHCILWPVVVALVLCLVALIIARPMTLVIACVAGAVYWAWLELFGQ